MRQTLQAIKNHKYSNILENIGETDITYNINFDLFKKFTNQFDELSSIISNHKKFLTRMGIVQRAEIISENLTFSEKSDLFYSCLLYTSPSPRDGLLSRMPSSA